jgi:hypothetical protein
VGEDFLGSMNAEAPGESRPPKTVGPTVPTTLFTSAGQGTLGDSLRSLSYRHGLTATWFLNQVAVNGKVLLAGFNRNQNTLVTVVFSGHNFTLSH